MIKFSILIILLSLNSWARPENVEIWYISSESASQDIGLNLIKSYSNLPSLAYSPVCEEVNGKCYDPQIGIYEKITHKNDREEDGYIYKSKIAVRTKKEEQKSESSADEKITDDPISFKEKGYLQANLITCDSRFYFDFYCGRANHEAAINNKESKKSKVELWIDTSSSLNSIDVPKAGQKCYRQLFYEKVINICGDNIYAHKYDTSLKELSGASDICFNYGLNSTEKLISWIEESDTKNLIIITDIGEFEYKMISFLQEIGATIKGSERRKPITGPDLVNLWKDVAIKCN